MPAPPWWPGGDDQAGRIPLSALEHYAYCPRQAALIHVDGVYDDNADTVRGTLAHEAVHRPSPVLRAEVAGSRIMTGVPVWSERLGLYGICDAVEVSSSSIVPVEHKIGPYLPGGPADVQAAAQAACLREMLDIPVPHAAVFSHRDRRRHRVALTEALLARVETIAVQLGAVLTDMTLPAAVNDGRCPRCSLRQDCLPTLVADPGHIDAFLPQPLGFWE